MPVPQQQAPPSPVVPIIVLVILGTMLTIPSMTAYDPSYWNDTVAEVQTHFVIGAFLIPICLLLLVKAFGLPQVNPVGPRTRSSPMVELLTQDLTSSILLVVVIFVLLMLIPLRSSIQAAAAPYGRNSRW